MSSESSIVTFLRIKPSKKNSNFITLSPTNKGSLTFNLPDRTSSDYINNSKLVHEFQFNGVLDVTATQDEVFKTVGVSAVQNALDGFNSTIFAYGQTGSGKTYTLTGGAFSYPERGIIPRTLSLMFEEFEKRRAEASFTVMVSYMELYNEQAYDLLDDSKENKTLEQLPKVQIREDEHGNVHFGGLQVVPAPNSDAALELLFKGDTNRTVAETPMNLASSRSHCIFTLNIESRMLSSDKIRVSKLHLVDLAGSERVSKTSSHGSILTEAKHINSSLFFLEQVIVALHEKATKGRQHIPYRNSIMTMSLKDSLGGNCKTIMVATISPEKEHTEESLSTCKFAQRVSLIKNKAHVNEEVDQALIIKRLQADLAAASEEIAFLKGETGEGDVLSPLDVELLKEQCAVYCGDMDPHSVLNIGALTLTKIKDTFAILKNMVLESRAAALAASGADGARGPAQPSDEKLLRQIKDLKSMLVQRDNEISVLVNMVKQGKTADDVGSARQRADRQEFESFDGESSRIVHPGVDMRPKAKQQPLLSQAEQKMQREKAREDKIIQRHLFGVPPPPDPRIFDDAAASFEWFRERCSLNGDLQRNAEQLKERITEAKATGEKANQSRSTITYLKNSIEAIRRERALHLINSSGGEDGKEENMETPDEITYRRAIEQEKTVYREGMERLKVLKPEIEYVRRNLELCRTSMQNQFDEWYNNLHSRGASALSSMQTHTNMHTSSTMSLRAENKITSESGPDGRDTKQSYQDAKESDKSNRSSSSRNTRQDESDEVNEDIEAFYQAKEALLKQRQSDRNM